MTTAWRAGEAYEPLIGRWSRLVAPRFVDWARLPSHAQVLDVGCGTGALSEALLARGASHVVGIDPSAGYVSYASSQLAGKGGNVIFEVGDAMQLRFPDNSFDAAVAGLVLNFITDSPKGVREMHRVVRHGGVVAACVWAYGEGMGMLRKFWDAAAALEPSARSLDEGVRFTVCRPERLRGLFGENGLRRLKPVLSSRRWSSVTLMTTGGRFSVAKDLLGLRHGTERGETPAVAGRT